MKNKSKNLIIITLLLSVFSGLTTATLIPVNQNGNVNIYDTDTDSIVEKTSINNIDSRGGVGKVNGHNILSYQYYDGTNNNLEIYNYSDNSTTITSADSNRLGGSYDFDNDNNDEFLIRDLNNNNALAYYDVEDDTTTQLGSEEVWTFGSISDTDNDDSQDIIYREASSEDLTVYDINDSTTTDLGITVNSDGSSIESSGDLDGDGDIESLNANSGPRIYDFTDDSTNTSITSHDTTHYGVVLDEDDDNNDEVWFRNGGSNSKLSYYDYQDDNVVSTSVNGVPFANALEVSQDSTNVTFYDFKPADGSTAYINGSQTFEVTVEADSNEYNDIDIEGIFDGNIEKVFNHPADGTNQTYSFSINDFNNTGSYTYRFSAISDSPNGDFIKDTSSRTLNVETDAPRFTLKNPNDGETFVESSSTFETNIESESEPGDNETFLFDLKIDKPDGTTETLQNDVERDPGFNYTEDGNYTFDGYGDYSFYLTATGKTSGKTFTSSSNTFTVDKESATIKFISPDATATSNFQNQYFTSLSSIDPWNKSKANPAWSGVLNTDTFGTSENCKNNPCSITYDDTNNEMILEREQQSGTVGSSGDYWGGYTIYKDPLRLEDDKHFITVDFQRVEAPSESSVNVYPSILLMNSSNLDFANNKGKKLMMSSDTPELTGNVTINLTYDSNAGVYDATYEESGKTYTATTEFKKKDSIYLNIGSSADSNIGTDGKIYSDFDSVRTDIPILESSGTADAYLDFIPFEADVSATTKNDQDATVEFIAGGSIVETNNIAGDGSTNNLKYNETYTSSIYGINTWVNVLGSDDQSIESTAIKTVDVVQPPEFNLTNPDNESRIEIDNREDGTDDTDFEGKIEIGETGTATVQLKEPNSTYRDIVSKSYDKSDVNNTVTILTNERVQDINLSEKNDENVLISPEYNWNIIYDGSDSGEKFNSGEASYNYISQVEGVVEIPIIFFGQINDRIKDATGSTGQFFIATIAILVLAGGFHTLMRIPIITIGTMVLLAFGFSVADGYYPIGVFWVLLAVTGLASAYFGSKAFGGGG